MVRRDENILTGTASGAERLAQAVRELRETEDQIIDAIQTATGQQLPGGTTQTIQGNANAIATLNTRADSLEALLAGLATTAQVQAANAAIAAATARQDALEAALDALPGIPAPPQPGEPPAPVSLGDLPTRLAAVEALIGGEAATGPPAVAATGLFEDIEDINDELDTKVNTADVADSTQYTTDAEVEAALAPIRQRLTGLENRVSPLETQIPLALEREHQHDDVTVVRDIPTQEVRVGPGEGAPLYTQIGQLVYANVAGPAY